MKIFSLVLILTSLVYAQTYKEFANTMGYETSYEVAIVRAKKEQKNIMLFMITNYCPWCSKMEKRVLNKKGIDNLIKSKYIPLIVNKEEKKFPKELDIPGSPVLYLISKDSLNVYEKYRGYMKKNELLNFLK